MCDFNIIESIGKSLIDRRHAIGGIGACLLGAASSNGGELPQDPRIQLATTVRPLDLTHTLHPKFPTYFGDQQFWQEKKYSVKNDGLNLNVNRASEHVGTHIDAPLHFSNSGNDVSQIAITHLVVPLSVIDIRDRAARDPDSQVTPKDIADWERKNGPLPRSGCVAMNSGWSKKITKPEFRGVDHENKLHFPGFHEEAAYKLLEDGNTIGLAVDTLSLDYGPSESFETHRAWLPTGRWGLECINNLDQVPAAGATLIVGAPKVSEGTGGHCRVFALI